jgi:integrase
VYYDEDQPGLQLRVSAAGTKAFSVLRRPRLGRPERYSIGKWPDITVRQARDSAKQIIAKLARAESPAEARRLLKMELTLGELLERYLADRERAGKRSVAHLRAHWERYLGEMPDTPAKKHGRKRIKPSAAVDWSKRRLSEITTQQINTLHTRIGNSGKQTTANRMLELLHAMFGFAVRQKLATENPAEGVSKAKENDRSRFIGRDELPLFVAALNEEPQPWRDYFMVLLYVGYRRSAVAAMRWGDIDLAARIWTVPGEKAKNGDPIVFPIGGPALSVLRRRWRERGTSAWVFPGRSAAGHLTQPKRAWARLVRRAGLADLRIHDLRRTLGSWLAMSGASLPAIGRALGHKDIRSTQIYARLQTEAVAGAVTVAHRAMRASLTNKKVVPLPVRRTAAP